MNNSNITALQSFLSHGNVSKEVTDALSDVIRKEKEKQVLQFHKYKISGPFVTKKQVIWSTRCPWLPNKKVNRGSYADIIDFLYEHYNGSANNKMTVREVYDRMIKEYEEEHTLSYLTLVHYKADWNKHVIGNKAEWLDKPIIEVKNTHILAFYRKITGDGIMKRSTFSNVKTVVNAVFDYGINNDISCIKASMIATNRLKFASQTDKWKNVFSPEDKKKILALCEQMNPTVYTKAVELMFCLDIRIGELRALQKDDVDLDARTIYVGHQMVDKQTETANRHPVRSDKMKGGKEIAKRTEPLSDRAVSVIVWLNEHFGNSIWLLPNKTGNEPIYTNRFNENLKKICDKAGVVYNSSHGIRFHNISAMYDSGIPEKEIQRLSGHTTANMTRHYNKHISDTCDDDRIRAVLG